jgi:hypothetical protein
MESTWMAPARLEAPTAAGLRPADASERASPAAKPASETVWLRSVAPPPEWA